MPSLIKHKSFVGKTIKRINTTCCNTIVFYFTDDTKVELEVEAINSSIGLYGIVEQK